MTKNEIETIIGVLTFIAAMIYVWFVREILFSDSPVLCAVALLAPQVWSCTYVTLAKGWQRQGRPYNEAVHVVAQMLAIMTALAWIGGLILIGIGVIR